MRTFVRRAYSLNLGWIYGKAGEDTTETSVATGNVRIGAIVNVEHEGIGTLD